MPHSRPEKERIGWDARFQASLQDKYAFLAARAPVIKHFHVLAAAKEQNRPDGLFVSPARAFPLKQPANTCRYNASSEVRSLVEISTT